MAKIPATPPKVDLPSSTEREREREIETHHSKLRTDNQSYGHREGPPMGPMRAGVSPRQMVRRRPNGSPFWVGRRQLLGLQPL